MALPRQQRIADRLLSARDAEKLLGIPASTIRTWWQRRVRSGLEAADFERGKPRFRESDLKRLRDGKRRVHGRPSAEHGELGRYLSAWEAQRILGIPVSTVNTWWQRRATTRLVRAGLDERGRLLFWEADLLALRLGLRLRDDEDERIHTMHDFLNGRES